MTLDTMATPETFILNHDAIIALKTQTARERSWATSNWIERVKYLMRLSPHCGQIWGPLPSSSITFNIYKPLNRINQEGTGGAPLPISSARPSGFVTEDLMNRATRTGFSLAALGQDPLLKPSSVEKRKSSAPGLSLDSTSHKALWCCSDPLLRLQLPHLLQELRRSDSPERPDNCESGLSCVCSLPHSIHAAAGG